MQCIALQNELKRAHRPGSIGTIPDDVFRYPLSVHVGKADAHGIGHEGCVRR